MFFGSSAVQFVFQTQTASEIWDLSHLSQSKQPRPELLHHVAPLSQGWEGLGGSQFPSWKSHQTLRSASRSAARATNAPRKRSLKRCAKKEMTGCS